MEPRIGVGVFVVNPEGKFVLGKRKGSHGAGQYSTTPFLTIVISSNNEGKSLSHLLIIQAHGPYQEGTLTLASPSKPAQSANFSKKLACASPTWNS